MNIGIPKEVMTGESRVALTPEACGQIIAAGHTIYMQTDAGNASGYPDDMYQQAGVDIVSDISRCYQQSELIVKVKQPLHDDLVELCNHHTVFSYLHLAADSQLTHQLCDIGVTAIPFESVANQIGQLPLLLPMSTIAGRIAAIRGANLLFKNTDGRGVLIGGINEKSSSIDNGNVVVLGAGVAGSNATATAVAMGANVSVFDLNEQRLTALKQRFASIETYTSTTEKVASACLDADLVIGSVLVAGRRAPIVLHSSTITQMRTGSVVIDVAIDQGGCVEDIHATNSEQLYYEAHGILHSAVPNMPAAVPRTATQALSAAVLPYVLQLANGEADASLHAATAITAGKIVDGVLLQETSQRND